MVDSSIVRTWNYIWEKLSTQVTGAPVASPFGASAPVITDPMTVYVETWGDDTYEGTSERPWRTIQKALNYFDQFHINASVKIAVGLGNFGGFILNPVHVRSPNGSFVLEGQLVSTGITGTFAITRPTATGISTLTDAGKTWTVDQFVGKLLKYSTDSGSTWLYLPIASNTATTMMVGNVVSNTGSAIYEIMDYGTVINTSVSAFGPTYGNSDSPVTTAGRACIVVPGAFVEGAGVNSQITVRRLNAVASDNVQAVAVSIRGSSAFMRFSSCNFTCNTTSSSAVITSTGVTGSEVITFDSCSIVKGTSSGTQPMFLSTAAGFSSIAFSGCAIVGNNGASIGGLNLNSAGVFSVTSCVIRNFAAYATQYGSKLAISSCSILNCGTGIQLSPAAFSTIGTGHVHLASVASSDINTCTTGISIGAGPGVLEIASTNTFTTNTTDISVNGVTSTAAGFRAGSPKVFPTTPNVYGSYVFE